MYVYRQPREHIHVSMCIYLSALVLPRKQVILVGKLVLHIGVTALLMCSMTTHQGEINDYLYIHMTVIYGGRSSTLCHR